MGPVQDDRLRLIFTRCHPALSTEAQVALTLQLLGGLSTREVARSFPGGRTDDGATSRACQAREIKPLLERAACDCYGDGVGAGGGAEFLHRALDVGAYCER